MNYADIQEARRLILTGVIRAPQPYGNVDPSTIRRKKKRRVSKKADDGWDNSAFIDNFYEDEAHEDEVDVSPDYFQDCEQLITSYYRSEDMPLSLSNAPLFSGSNNSAKDLGRFLLAFKARHLKVGDGILGNIVAMMATFLPSDNMLRKWLPDNTSTYLLLKTLDNMAAYDSQLRCLKIDCCVSKCMGFYATNAHLNFCLICGKCRWKLCTRACYGDDDDRKCRHLQTPRSRVYYNVVQDRLVKLLKSDLKNLFNYQSHRGGKSTCIWCCLNRL